MIVARRLQVQETSGASQARRAAAGCARHLGFDPHDAARAALVATEIAMNLVRHAGGGELLLLPVTGGTRPALHILSLDKGPGFVEGVARRDGYSTVGGAGTGLGAVARASDRFSIYSLPGRGTATLSEIAAPAAAAEEPPVAPARFQVGGFSVARPGEEVCGDDWAVFEQGDGLTIALADGLGHGPGAFQAAHAATQGFLADPCGGPAQQLARLHELLRPTRGAAVAVARIDGRRGHLAYAGVGNTIGFIDDGDRVRHMVSHNGTLGHEMPRVKEFDYPWPPAALLVMATDGLTTRVDLAEYPGLRRQPPTLIAAILYRDFRRGQDDATVLVAAEAAL